MKTSKVEHVVLLAIVMAVSCKTVTHGFHLPANGSHTARANNDVTDWHDQILHHTQEQTSGRRQFVQLSTTSDTSAVDLSSYGYTADVTELDTGGEWSHSQQIDEVSVWSAAQTGQKESAREEKSEESTDIGEVVNSRPEAGQEQIVRTNLTSREKTERKSGTSPIKDINFDTSNIPKYNLMNELLEAEQDEETPQSDSQSMDGEEVDSGQGNNKHNTSTSISVELYSDTSLQDFRTEISSGVANNSDNKTAPSDYDMEVEESFSASLDHHLSPFHALDNFVEGRLTQSKTWPDKEKPFLGSMRRETMPGKVRQTLFRAPLTFLQPEENMLEESSEVHSELGKSTGQRSGQSFSAIYHSQNHLLGSREAGTKERTLVNRTDVNTNNTDVTNTVSNQVRQQPGKDHQIATTTDVSPTGHVAGDNQTTLEVDDDQTKLEADDRNTLTSNSNISTTESHVTLETAADTKTEMSRRLESVLKLPSADVPGNLPDNVIDDDDDKVMGDLKKRHEDEPRDELVSSQPRPNRGTVKKNHTDDEVNLNLDTSVWKQEIVAENTLADDTGSLEDDTGIVEDDTGSLADETGSLADDTGSLIDDTGSLIDDTGSLIDDTGSLADETGSLADDTGSLADDTGSLIDDTGSLIDDTGSRADDTGSLADNKGSLADAGDMEILLNLTHSKDHLEYGGTQVNTSIKNITMAASVGKQSADRKPVNVSDVDEKPASGVDKGRQAHSLSPTFNGTKELGLGLSEVTKSVPSTNTTQHLDLSGRPDHQTAADRSAISGVEQHQVVSTYEESSDQLTSFSTGSNTSRRLLTFDVTDSTTVNNLTQQRVAGQSGQQTLDSPITGSGDNDTTFVTSGNLLQTRPHISISSPTPPDAATAWDNTENKAGSTLTGQQQDVTKSGRQEALYRTETKRSRMMSTDFNMAIQHVGETISGQHDTVASGPGGRALAEVPDTMKSSELTTTNAGETESGGTLTRDQGSTGETESGGTLTRDQGSTRETESGGTVARDQGSTRETESGGTLTSTGGGRQQLSASHGSHQPVVSLIQGLGSIRNSNNNNNNSNNNNNNEDNYSNSDDTDRVSHTDVINTNNNTSVSYTNNNYGGNGTTITNTTTNNSNDHKDTTSRQEIIFTSDLLHNKHVIRSNNGSAVVSSVLDSGHNLNTRYDMAGGSRENISVEGNTPMPDERHSGSKVGTMFQSLEATGVASLLNSSTNDWDNKDRLTNRNRLTNNDSQATSPPGHSPWLLLSAAAAGTLFISIMNHVSTSSAPKVSAYKVQDFSLLKPADNKKAKDKNSDSNIKTNKVTTRSNSTTTTDNSINNITSTSDISNKAQASQECSQSVCGDDVSVPVQRPQAAVSAVLTSHFGPTKDQLIPFDLELLDLADNYDNTTGMFICTIPGTYVISLYLMSHPGAKVNARVFINNRPIAALWADDAKNAGFYPSSSTQTIGQLGFGDQVYVMLVDGGYGESWVHANYNVFTVFLLYEQIF